MYLAKRCYDLAAETSPDAKIPVALALIKLSLYFTFKYFKEVSIKNNVFRNFFTSTEYAFGDRKIRFNFQKHLSNWYMLLNIDYLLGTYWDIYLVAVLAFALCYIIYRRPH